MKFNKTLLSVTIFTTISISFLNTPLAQVRKQPQSLTQVKTPSQSKRITWKEVATKVKNVNYTIEENRIKLRQSKEYAKYARLSLLPKLNLWKLLDFSSDTKGIFGFIEDLVPFLIPANWNKAKQAEILALAAEESYKTVLANELLNAKILYNSINNDRNLVTQLKRNQGVITELYQFAEARSEFGHDELLIKNHLQSLLLQNKEDILVINQVIKEEKLRLLNIMGSPITSQYDLSEIPSAGNLNLKSHEVELILSNSPELKVYDSLIQVSGLIKDEIYFSFLGGSSLSKGFYGGIFDAIPVDGGLGFSTPSQIKIAKDQTALLNKQKEASRALIDLQYQTAAEIITSLREQLVSANEIYQFSIQRVENLKDKMYLGQKINLAEFSDSLLSLSKATAKLYLVQNQIKQNQFKLERMLWKGDFLDLPKVPSPVDPKSKSDKVKNMTSPEKPSEPVKPITYPPWDTSIG